MNTLLVFIGGGIGAALRHGVNVATVRSLGVAFPYGTFTVNVVGSLAMGLLIGWLATANAGNDVRLFAATGVLGGFTTFSAFSLDAANLWERGAEGAAFAYVLGTVVIGVSALFLGLWLARS